MDEKRKNKKEKKKLTNLLADNGHKAQADLEELSVKKKVTLTNKQNRIMRIGNNWKERK